MNKFTLYSDPAHGWLRVTPADVYDVGLTRAHFTPYSYRAIDDCYWYLEEDADASIFIRAWEKKHGGKFPLKESVTNGRSSIRSKQSLWNYSTWNRDAWAGLTKEAA
jgi:hypothetical protein